MRKKVRWVLAYAAVAIAALGGAALASNLNQPALASASVVTRTGEHNPCPTGIPNYGQDQHGCKSPSPKPTRTYPTYSHSPYPSKTATALPSPSEATPSASPSHAATPSAVPTTSKATPTKTPTQVGPAGDTGVEPQTTLSPAVWWLAATVIVLLLTAGLLFNYLRRRREAAQR